MCDTPETNAAIETIGEAYIGADGTSSSPREIVDPEFSRTLERQRNEARKDFNDLVVDGQHFFIKNLQTHIKDLLAKNDDLGQKWKKALEVSAEHFREGQKLALQLIDAEQTIKALREELAKDNGFLFCLNATTGELTKTDPSAVDTTAQDARDAIYIDNLKEALSKCIVQLGHIKAGYILGSKIEEAYNFGLTLLDPQTAHDPYQGNPA